MVFVLKNILDKFSFGLKLECRPSEASSSEVKAAVESACLVLFLCLLSLPYAPLVV